MLVVFFYFKIKGQNKRNVRNLLIKIIINNNKYFYGYMDNFGVSFGKR